MTRGLLSALGALLGGAVFWAVFGALAAYAGSRGTGGAREGAAAMGGFFFIGPVFGLIGMIACGWITWTALARPERTSVVLWSLAGTAALLIGGVSYALRPTVVLPDDYPGQRAELCVEVSFPEAELARLGDGALTFEFRSADGTETAPAQRNAIRHEAGRAVVPAIFAIRARPRSKLLAVMQGEKQVACSTLTVEGETAAGTEWSGWQDLESGLQARWRLVVSPQ